MVLTSYMENKNTENQPLTSQQRKIRNYLIGLGITIFLIEVGTPVAFHILKQREKHSTAVHSPENESKRDTSVVLFEK